MITPLRAIVTVDGATASSGNTNLFAHAGFVGGKTGAKNVNLCGVEYDVGLNATQAQATNIARSGVTLLSMGSPKGSLNNDAAINICSGPQYVAGVQEINKAGWRVGLQWTNAFAATGYGEPISYDGYLAYAVGSWGAYRGIDVSNVNFTDAAFKSQNFAVKSGTIEFTAPNCVIELGAPSTASTVNIDFHSSGVSNDYDVRMYATGGSGTNGGGALVVAANTLALAGVELRPTIPNTGTVGTSSTPWAGGFTQTAFTTTSDARIKTNVVNLDPKWIAFLRALRPVSYVFQPDIAPAVMATRTVKRQKMQAVEVWDYVTSTVDGVTASRKTLVSREFPVTEEIPVLDENGQPEMVQVNNDNTVSETGRPIFKLVPKMISVPVMEDVTEEYEVTPATDQTFVRLHVGFLAQEVRQALHDSGLDTDPDATKSVWALFVYDPAADRFSLRYEEFIGLLALGFQALDARVAALEAA